MINSFKSLFKTGISGKNIHSRYFFLEVHMKDYIKQDKQKRLKGYLIRDNIYSFSLYYLHFSLLYLS